MGKWNVLFSKPAEQASFDGCERWRAAVFAMDIDDWPYCALQADVSMNGKKVASALNQARRERKNLPEIITVDNGLNASEKVRMSAEEVCSTQDMQAVGEIRFRKSRVPEMVFHEMRDPAHHNEHKICAGAQS